MQREKIINKRTVCFSVVADEWMNYKKITHKRATHAKYEYLIDQHILPYFKNVEVSKMSPLLINEFAINKLENGRLDGQGGLSSSYVRSMVVIISSIMDYAISVNLCKPFLQKTIKPVPQKKEPPTLSLNQQKQLEKYLFSEKSLTNLGILLSLYTGLRIGEVCALKWEDIDLNGNILHVRATVARVKKEGVDRGYQYIIDSPKTKTSIRDIPIPSKILNVIKSMKGTMESNYILSDSAMFLSPRIYDYQYHKAIKNSGLEYLNYHSLRHSFATRCIEVGIDVKTLSEILGHSNVAITLNTYVHSSMDLKREQIEKLCY